MTADTRTDPDLRAGRALDALAAALGADAVQRNDIGEFADPYRPAGTSSPVAGVVFPSSTAQVQAVLRIASGASVPVWTHSMGRNYGYGGAEPMLRGSIALSLRRMNRVLDVDDEHGVAVIEPGVTFFDLFETLRAGGHRYQTSVPDLGWGSVLGNALEHGLGYTQSGEHVEGLCGMEVVLATGDVLRTGTGGITGTPTFHLHKRGFGPSLDGLFTQSNLGVVTRAGVWLTPEPECILAGRISAPREADLPALVETLRPLMLDRTITSFPMIGHGFGVLATVVPREHWPELTGPGTEAELAPMLAALGMGIWNMRLSLAGRREVVAAQRAVVERAFGRLPGVSIDFTEYEPPYDAETIHPPAQVVAGIPNMGLLRILDPWGGHGGTGGHLDFSPVSPFTGRHASAVFDTVQTILRRHQVPSASAVLARSRSLIHVNMLMFDSSDAEAVERTHHTYRELLGSVTAQGLGLYRSHIDVADEMASTYDFGGHSLHRTLRTIKDALDPQGILSPGKQGVWPSTSPAGGPG